MCPRQIEKTVFSKKQIPTTLLRHSGVKYGPPSDECTIEIRTALASSGLYYVLGLIFSGIALSDS